MIGTLNLLCRRPSSFAAYMSMKPWEGTGRPMLAPDFAGPVPSLAKVHACICKFMRILGTVAARCATMFSTLCSRIFILTTLFFLHILVTSPFRKWTSQNAHINSLYHHSFDYLVFFVPVNY